MEKFLIVANIKQNPLPTYNFVAPSGVEVAIAPQPPQIPQIPQGFVRAAQNVDNNARQLRDLGVKYCLVGHSYYRNNFGETNEMVWHNTSELLEAGIVPIICARNLEEIPKNLRPASLAQGGFAVMYEPEYAISTNGVYHPETPDKINDVLSTFPQEARLLYGGSVNLENCKLIINNCKLVSGFVVGHGCLNPEEFFNIINQCLPTN